MVQVAAAIQQARIEHFLEYALREWRAVPEYVGEFDSWDPIQQLAFVHEWAIRESALAVLTDYSKQGLLTPEQRVRYDELLRLVQQHRPILERLLAD